MIEGPTKPGLKSSEFWLLMTKLLVGAGLTVYGPTREIGALILGLGGPDGKAYLDARTMLKQNGAA